VSVKTPTYSIQNV